MNVIDPHLHLFDLKLGSYQWLKAENPPFWPDKWIINRSFTEQDLTLETQHLSGFVHIEAGFNNEEPWQEISWLETSVSVPFRSVACADITQPASEFNEALARLKPFRSCIGVRHILDDQAVSILGSEHVLNNLTQLSKHRLSFELQLSIFDIDAIEAWSKLSQQLPDLKVIVNHAGFPPADRQSKDWQEWLTSLSVLAQHPRTAIKCSGWEMIDRQINIDWINAVVQACLSAFGNDRVMLASNFPLTLFTQSYEDYWAMFEPLSPATKKALFYDNAFYWYDFSDLISP